MEPTIIFGGLGILATAIGVGFKWGQSRNGYVKESNCKDFRGEIRRSMRDLDTKQIDMSKDVSEIKGHVEFIRGKIS